MKAEKQGYITHEEWTRGLKALRADTIDELKKALPELEKEVQISYAYVLFFSYSLSSSHHSTMLTLFFTVSLRSGRHQILQISMLTPFAIL